MYNTCTDLLHVSFLLTTEDNTIHVSVANGNSQELQSSLRPELNNASTANGVNTGPTDALSRQPPFQQLSSCEQEELKAMLDDDVRKMKCLFGYLVTKTCESVEERIPVVRFAASILGLGAYDPAPEERDRSLLNEHREEIKKAKSISEIFSILSAYWNYLNYEILEYAVDLHGTGDDKKRLQSYDEEFHNFCKRRIFELSLPGSGTLSPRQEQFDVKLNVREDITCKDLLRIRRRIAKTLRVNLAVLVIDRMNAGYVQLTFLIPKFIAQELVPLSDEQTSALARDASVIRLECGDYVFKVLKQFCLVLLKTSFPSCLCSEAKMEASEKLAVARNQTHNT